jgi:hypothetical protein
MWISTISGRLHTLSKAKKKKETGEDKKLFGVKHTIAKKNKTSKGGIPPEEFIEKKSNLKPGDKRKKRKNS